MGHAEELASDPVFRPIPRTILAFYDGSTNQTPWNQAVHRMAEMPLNHLGLHVRHHDLFAPLPDQKEMQSIRGILLWMERETMPAPEAFLRWARQAMAQGVRIVVMGIMPFKKDLSGRNVPDAELRDFWRTFGLDPQFDWIRFTHNYALVDRDPDLFDFERRLTGVIPSFGSMKRLDPAMRVHLAARSHRDPATDAILVSTGPRGGYVAESYSDFTIHGSEVFRQWYINPFVFFENAFATETLLKPDTNTLSNRRIYYSHIDGDGWRNFSDQSIHKTVRQDEKKYASEVILEQIVLKYSNLPVTVAPIQGDLDPQRFGNPRLMEVARSFFLQPNVEIGSHTDTHPLFWNFFEDYTQEKEAPYLHYYPKLKNNGFTAQLLSLVDWRNRYRKVQMDTGKWKELLENARKEKRHEHDQEKIIMDYQTPRVYHFGPFKLQDEIQGAINFLNELAPPEKKVMVMQWSGDTMPFEQAIAATREAGVGNINGGDSRFDRQFPSVAWVAPLGRQVGKEWQTYASNSNENTYTELWSANFFGFKHLIKTARNTETPRRIKPFNVYYHMYSGERIASLNALRHNLNQVAALPMAPVFTGQFVAMVQGAIATRLEQAQDGRFRIRDRGALESVRLDSASHRAVDFTASHGVIGQRHFQGSLYVALDGAHPEPVVLLRDHHAIGSPPHADVPYLLEGRWRVWGVERGKNGGVTMQSQGFGPGEFVWNMPVQGAFRIQWQAGDHPSGTLEEQTDTDGLLRFTLPDLRHERAHLQIIPATQKMNPGMAE